MTIKFNEENVPQVFKELIQVSKTAGLNAGKMNKTRALHPEDVVRLFSLIINNASVHSSLMEMDKIFYTFDSIKRDFGKLRKMEYGLPQEFKDRVKSAFGIEFVDDEKRLEAFLDTGVRLYTYLTYKVIGNAIRRDQYALENMKEQMASAKRLFDLLGLKEDDFPRD